MPLLIPVAKDKTGETVTPTCSKDDGPFTCLGCSKPLVLRQGEKNRWHFAHHSKDNEECSAGGESYIHKAAKLLLVNYITRFEFAAEYGRRQHMCEKVYHGCTAAQEQRLVRGVQDVSNNKQQNLGVEIQATVGHGRPRGNTW